MIFQIATCPDNRDYILIGEPEYAMTADGMTLTADYVCKSADLASIMQDWYGMRCTAFGQSGQKIAEPKKITAPTSQSGAVSYLYCDGLSFSPWSPLKGDVTGTAGGSHVPSGARGIISADYYRISAHFSESDPFVEERFEQGGQMGALSTTDLYWSPGGDDKLKIDAQVDGLTFLHPTGEWIYTIKRSRIVYPNLSTLRGKINGTTMYSRQMLSAFGTPRSFAPETVLFMGMTLTPVYVPFGNTYNVTPTPYWRIDYRFLINENTWNEFPRPIPGTTNPVYTGLCLQVAGTPPTYSDYKPYQSIDTDADPEEPVNLNVLLFNPKE
jgi:hypothetical protein